MKGVMIQGTASDVGKSLVVTALCRILVNEGVKVGPFKSQNMSNNSYITVDGSEIGRAQGIQAEAAKTEATVWMNPILLKPRSDLQSEVVFLGKVQETLSGRSYRETFYEKGLEVIKSSINRLESEFDVVVVEGAGSPVEINLKDRELVNMKVAEIADVPVILVADIDRGGVFASIVGTLELFTPEERGRVKGIIINKFRGDISLFQDGVQWLEKKTGIPVLGVLPYIHNHMIDGEDSLSIESQFSKKTNRTLDIAVMHLPYISNYSDLEPFNYEEDVSIRFVKHPEQFGNPDAVIIPGTKSTISDLTFLRESGLETLIKEHVNDGGHIVGICGGYQMLGRTIIDREGSDTGVPLTTIKGLNFIQAQTEFYKEKTTVRAKGLYHPESNIRGMKPVEGFEIHLGQTKLEETGFFLKLENGIEEGFFGNDGQIIGTYLHHLFHNDEWRNIWLNTVRKKKDLSLREVVHIENLKDERFDLLASQIKTFLDWEKVKGIIFGESL